MWKQKLTSVEGNIVDGIVTFRIVLAMPSVSYGWWAI